MQQVGWCSSSLLYEILKTLKEKVASKEEHLQTKGSLHSKRSERIQALNSGDTIVSHPQQMDDPPSKRCRTEDANWSNIQYYFLPGGKAAWDHWGHNCVSKETIELFKSGNHPQMFQKCTVCNTFVVDAELHIQGQHALQEAPREMSTADVGEAAGMEMSEVECQTPRRAATKQLTATLPHVLSPLRRRLVQIGGGVALAHNIGFIARCLC
jgi:hypothetical protein